MTRILSRLFGAPEEINGGARCPTYLWRWTLFPLLGGKVYAHKFTGEDWSKDLHDHPKRFVSIGLWGSYLEEFASSDLELQARYQMQLTQMANMAYCAEYRLEQGLEISQEEMDAIAGKLPEIPYRQRIFRAPWIRSFPAEHKHRLTMRTKNVWTLVWVGGSTRPWGFWHKGEWMHWRKYVSSEAGDTSKSCPD